MEKTARAANWNGEQYVVNEPLYTDDERRAKWFSIDGDNWLDYYANVVDTAEFHASTITLHGGPRDGETVS
jgi:hypothetical protein